MNKPKEIISALIALAKVAYNLANDTNIVVGVAPTLAASIGVTRMGDEGFDWMETTLSNVIAGLPTRGEVTAAICQVKDTCGVDAAKACYILEVGGTSKMADIPEEMLGIVMRNCREALAKGEAVKPVPPAAPANKFSDYDSWVAQGLAIFNEDPTDAGKKRWRDMSDSTCTAREIHDSATLRDEIAMRVSAADCAVVFGIEYLSSGMHEYRRATEFAEARYKIADATIAARSK